MDKYKTQELLTLIEKIAHVATWHCDVAKNVAIWSPKLIELFGEDPKSYSPTVHSFTEYIHSADQERVKNIIDTAIANHSPFSYDARIVRKDSMELSIHVEGLIETDQTGNTVSLYGIAQDITLLKQKEIELTESEERFKQIAEYIHEVFWMTDPTKNNMLYISPGYEKIWGHTVASLLANPKDWMEAITEEDRDRVLDAAIHKQTQGTYNEIYRIKRPNGQIRWIHDRAYPIKNDKGEVYRVVGVAQDITDAKKSEDVLTQRTQELEELNQSFVGRELKMVELKEENTRLKKQVEEMQK